MARRRKRDALDPLAVDAALEDESLTALDDRGSRRELAAGCGGSDKARRAIDEPHAGPLGAAKDAAVGADMLAALSEQIELICAQQEQLRVLWETAER